MVETLGDITNSFELTMHKQPPLRETAPVPTGQPTIPAPEAAGGTCSSASSATATKEAEDQAAVIHRAQEDAAMKAGAVAHGIVDRQRREWATVMHQASQHEKTKDNVLLNDLQVLLDAMMDNDQKFEKVAAQQKINSNLTATEIEEVKTLSKEIAQLAKQGGKIQNVISMTISL